MAMISHKMRAFSVARTAHAMRMPHGPTHVAVVGELAVPKLSVYESAFACLCLVMVW